MVCVTLCDKYSNADSTPIVGVNDTDTVLALKYAYTTSEHRIYFIFGRRYNATRIQLWRESCVFLSILFEEEETVRFPAELSNATDRPDGPTAARKKSRKAASFAESAKSLRNLV